LMKLTKLKEKLGLKKKENMSEENKPREPPEKEGKFSRQTKRSRRVSLSPESSGSPSLTEKLKAAFHEEPKEDKELERQKELDQTVRGFRKSFRQDMRNGAKKIGERIVAKEKRKEEDSDQTST